MTRNNIFCTTE